MTYVKHLKRVAGFMGLGLLLAACAPTEDMDSSLKSGYFYATSGTQAMQDEDIDNPAFIWVDIGEEMWSKVEGEAGKSCASCHGGDASSLKGVSVSYPKFNKDDGKLRALQDQINAERTERMKAKPWKWEGDQMLGMTAYIKLQSRGMPVNVAIDGKAAPFYEKGKAFFNQRRGGLNMSCKNCHVDYPGKYIRANLLSNGLPNGFPTYRLKWQKVGSLHRRFRGCNKNVRAQPYKQGSDEYTNLELYISSRANGVASEAPAVRM